MNAGDALSTSTEVVSSDNCLSTTVDDESVILHMEQGKYYGFNEVGTRVWEFIQEPHTVDEICEFLLAEYEVTEERSRNDVRELVAELVEKNLARIVGD